MLGGQAHNDTHKATFLPTVTAAAARTATQMHAERACLMCQKLLHSFLVNVNTLLSIASGNTRQASLVRHNQMHVHQW
jgi:hypothetical protein